MSYQLERYYARRTKMIEYLGGKCVHCGTTENLEIDHINPDDKSFSVSKFYDIKWEKLAIELDKCQLLCEEAHKTKHESEHGYSRYRHYGCRCDICKDDERKHRLSWGSQSMTQEQYEKLFENG